MIFGIREVRQNLGRFSGENHEDCPEGCVQSLVRITRFLVVFWINLIPLGIRYQTVCDSCETAKVIDKLYGQRIAKTEYGRRVASANAAVALRLCAFALVLAAAVVLPLTLIKPAAPGPKALKNMVQEDGILTILDGDGHILGIVENVNGQKTLSFYEKTTRLTGEPGADGSFIRREYYTESPSGSVEIDGVLMERIADNPGQLEDRYGIAVRVYHYDAAAQSLGYARGIHDLTAIAYQRNRAEYPFVYYANDKEESYVTVLYIRPDSRIEATFLPSEDGTELLAVVIYRKYENGRISTESLYQFTPDIAAAAQQQNISRNSTRDEIDAFIESADLMPITVLTYGYYKNTKVYNQVDLSLPVDNGTMQSVSQPFEIIEKDGYYLQTARQ